MMTGHPLFAGDLPEAVAAVPLVHLLGGLAGAVAFGVERSSLVVEKGP
jgi:hypothetical protein